jgi:hypothetical protein
MVTTATLRDHLAAQGAEAAELFKRGAKVQKREPAAGSLVGERTEFVAVRVEPATEPKSGTSNPLCRVTHPHGHVLEFSEWPEAKWLATLLSAMLGPAQ